MKFQDSKYFKTLKHYKLEKPFGHFYFFETFFISELNEGVHFDWEKVIEVMDELINFYGKDIKLAYLSNRINSYSTDPRSWEKVHKKYNIIIASAIVYYNDFTFMNATLEKKFSKRSIKRCLSLDEAIQWLLNLKEFN